MAQILLDDFFEHTEQCAEPDAKHFLRARFTHAEAIIPFAALLQIPLLSDKSTPMDETYTYDNNGWRGELVSPMAANIQWDIYRYSNRSSTGRMTQPSVLIRMLYNEYPVPFKDSCRLYDRSHPFFYALDELKRCYRAVETWSVYLCTFICVVRLEIDAV